uniref:Uncharacterized protein n=1 Tax=Pithovirus LCPAC304 TaxID=2506594 RepID=A0A481ZBI0_9VIRU|nr:MAG: hypothetical protein LCPAC304_03780 [Pithovirus LCPAC304]
MDEATINTLKMMQLMRCMFEEEAAEIRNDEMEQRMLRSFEEVDVMIEAEAAEIRNDEMDDEMEAIALLEELISIRRTSRRRRSPGRRPPPQQEMLTYENTVQKIDVDWHSVDTKYIAQVAHIFFQRNHKNVKVQSDVITAHVLCALKKQRHQDILRVKQVCCTNRDCVNVSFIPYVLEACKHVFREIQYF